MPRAGGKDRNVARCNLQHLALVAAEAHFCASARDAECLVHDGVIMRKVVDAVTPHRAPAVGLEQAFDSRFGMAARHIHRALVDKEGHRVVRYKSVVGKNEGEGFCGCFDG